MSEAKFTKGDWFVVEANNEITVTCDDYDIFTCWTDADDANLIATAPEMYEMLEYVMKCAAMQDNLTIDANEISKLLAKARGEHV